MKPKIINLPKIIDPRGNLSFFEYPNQLPFEIARTYWIYDVPGGESRGSHAFKEQQEYIIALSGSFDIVLNDGEKEERFTLNRSYYGLYIPKMLWRTIENFSTNSLALIVSDKNFDANDYIRDFREFKKVRNGK
ncbi:WxcM-like domain-containing protein [Kaistella solincola]|uniref:WxcM-like domain-containing protein n=1 Tax=Kaistella solincola TaxID=510955 RepID=A0ABR4ZNK3_9FLAO|nr:FdtA/QdtA family cupin domain-containing protein [Kaistella solincola]KIA82872.1 WxcM-like domain-containing protein [Kaistella solincola]